MVKIEWKEHYGRDATWKMEEEMKVRYPKLFLSQNQSVVSPIERQHKGGEELVLRVLISNIFVSHLYTALAQKGIHTFKDDEKLKKGKSISLELQKAIQESRWCLDELVEILECSNTTIYPIFYNVKPSEVQSQTGSFGGVFAKLVSKQGVLGMETVQRSESMFIQELVGILFRKLNHTYSSVSEDLVGMDSPMEKVIAFLGLGIDDTRAVGIWGMGGIGKTTIARAIYDHISSQFEGCSFIDNVREVSAKSGLKTLQEQLIFEILMEKDLKIGSVGSGVSMIRNIVCRKKVLIVFDNVDESTELEKLVGEHHWFSFGSKIIITTRNQHALTRYGITHIYEVEELGEDDAIELFKSKAFGKQQQMEDYGELVHHAITYAKGVPLALKVLGSFLCGQNKDEWESSLNRLKESPLNEVQQVLRIRYDALQLVEKEIFLNIACFFRGKNKNDVTKILDSCGFHPIIGIDVLVKKSLVTISDNKLMMHDLIQELGWYIVCQKSPKEPGECSRLWLQEDLTRVLMENTGTKNVEGIAMDYPDLGHQDPKDVGLKELKLRPKAFAKMSNLKILKMCCIHVCLPLSVLKSCSTMLKKHEALGARLQHLTEDLKYLSNKLRYLDWCRYPMKCMPSTFQPECLVELHLTYSSIEQLWEGTMSLTQRTSLVNLHPSIGILRRLICLNLKDCKNLKSLPSDIQLESLEVLNVSGCSKLENISVNFGYMKCLSQLYLDGISVSELPPLVGHLTGLGSLNLSNCKNLKSIPANICQLKALTSLNLTGCSKVDKLPQDLGFLDCLEELHADCTAIRQVPSSIGLLKKLEILSFRGGCKRLTSNSWSSFFLPLTLFRQRENSMTLELAALSRLESLQELDPSYCNLKSIRTSICHIYSLQQLNLSGNSIESLPANMNQLSKLSSLHLEGCKRLKELPEFSSSVHKILADDCTSLRTILSPSIFKNVDIFSFMNCFKLIKNKQNNILTENFLSNLFQVLSLSLSLSLSLCTQASIVTNLYCAEEF
ncbi:TMV resistance protein N-like [Camellia sinensis]|uniref:TMV resistance protein N-like n=1 Tax=Camellia sinensis TaxID=4442 RepID=UPI0010360AC5|nr:TMV resistance protein N-like [Camellia sinensis]